MESQGRDKVSQLGCSDKKTEFLFMMVQILSLIWNQVHFRFKIPGKFIFLKSQIDQSSPRFFLIEILTLGLLIPLILT